MQAYEQGLTHGSRRLKVNQNICSNENTDAHLDFVAMIPMTNHPALKSAEKGQAARCRLGRGRR